MNTPNTNTPAPCATPVKAVDPWQMQRTLMAASSQSLPAKPEINRDVMLYAALNLEELSEMVNGLANALGKLAEGPAEVTEVGKVLKQASTEMHEHSLVVRGLLSQVPATFSAPVDAEDLVEMADGTTDVTVVNSGFALALGLDGAACYDEVAGSNLSKINPDTGVIDKTPDGKWIKGRDYRAPNLSKVVLGR